ncbi:magnesium transporter MgtE N-terminal domain-containing protein [Clostridium sp. DL1XJH146]
MKRLNSFYLSEILNKKIIDEYGDCIGKLTDVYAITTNGYPKAIGYKVKKDGEVYNYEFRNIDFVENGNKIEIQVRLVKDIIPREYTFLLWRNLMNKQIIDVNGKKVVRVNDLRIAVINGEIKVLAVETGLLALSRRYKLSFIVQRIFKIIKKDYKDTVVMWDDVESLEIIHDGLKVSVPYKKIARLHPADIADIIEEVDLKYRNKIFESLDKSIAADTLEEIEPEVQAGLLESLDHARIKELLVDMPNDEIADILEEVDEKTAEKVLLNLEHDDEEIVRGLMKYKEQTCGSVMTTDHMAFNLNIEVGEIIDLLREVKPDERVLHYIYIIDEFKKTIGMVSIRDLVLADPSSKIKEIMEDDVISVIDNENINSAVKKFIKYDLVAIPVINLNEELQGVVLINDVMDEIFKEGWTKLLKKAV